MNLTKVDWMGFRTKADLSAVMDTLAVSFQGFGADLNLKHRSGGWRGFERSADIFLRDLHLGLVAFGGEHQRGWLHLNITGKGCAWLDADYADDVCSRLPAFELTRVDVALDTWKREATHESVIAAYDEGLFKLGGRPPKLRQILPGQPTEGRTVYIGDRSQAKFLRGYEKGYELIKDISPELPITHIDGMPVGDMYRLELELKNKGVSLPSDLIPKRDQYFAGAYPFLQNVIAVEPEIFITKRDREPQLSLEAALSQVRRQYGNTLFTALMAMDGDVGAVWQKIVGRKHNADLLAAGVLMVRHDLCSHGGKVVSMGSTKERGRYAQVA